ncbi:MAG: RBBP9/YdeN family alpha/beta hydrolase [Bdellovibrionales bacterium]
MNFLIMHGTMGSPDGNWFPWMKAQLEALGHHVWLPRFPTPENQNYTSWRSVAMQALHDLDPSQTILIGHSMGCALSFRLAEEADRPYRAIFAVAPFIDKTGVPEFDPLVVTFIEHAFDWARVKKGAGVYHLYAGDNDPYVSPELTRRVEDALGQPVTFVPGGGHLNAEFGYTSFPLLLQDVLAEVGGD